MDGAERLASVLGAVAAGGLIAIIGAANVVLLDAISFATGAVLLLLVPAGRAAARAEAGLRAYFADLREGLRFARSHPLTRSVAVMLVVTSFVDAAVSGLLLLMWARTTGVGAPGLGVVAAAFGAAAVVGAGLYTTFGPRLPRRRIFAWSFLVAGAPRLLALALPLPFGVVVAVWVVSGIGAGALNPALAAAQYATIPPRLLARVLAAVNAAAWAGIPLGGLVAGIGVDTIGLIPALVALAVLYAAATLGPFVRPSWRAMDRTSSAQPMREGAALEPS